MSRLVTCFLCLFALAATVRGETAVELRVPVEGQPLSANITRVLQALQFLGTPLSGDTIKEVEAAAQALDEVDLPTQALASIAKKEEIIYVRGREDEPIILEKHSPVLHLIQMIRDETHRFAITFHRQRRGKRTLTSVLFTISGISEKTSKLLLRKFGSAREIEQTSLKDLSKEIAPRLAKRVYEYFHPKT